MTKQTADKQNWNLDEKKQREEWRRTKWTRNGRREKRNRNRHWKFHFPIDFGTVPEIDKTDMDETRVITALPTVAQWGGSEGEGGRGVRQMTFAFNHKFAGRAFGSPSQAQLSPRHNLMAINNFSTAKTNTNLHFRNTKSALNCKTLPPCQNYPPPFLLRQIIMAERVGDAILAWQVCLRFQICLCISLHMSLL